MPQKRTRVSGHVSWQGEVKRGLPGGETYHRSRCFPTKREAAAWEDGEQARLNDIWAAAALADKGIIAPQPTPRAASPSLMAFATEVWWPVVERTLSPSTLVSYRSHWKRVDQAFGQTLLPEITSEAVRGFIDSYPGSRPARALTPLSACLSLALEKGLVQTNAVHQAGVFSSPAKSRWVPAGEHLDDEDAEPEHHTPEELEAVLSSWPWREYPTEGWAVRLALKCALRLGEVRALRPEDVHLVFRWPGLAEGEYLPGSARPSAFVRGWLDVRQNTVRGEAGGVKGWFTKRPKNGKCRFVPVPASVAWALLPLLDSSTSGACLLERNGEPLDGSGSRAPLQRLVREVQESLDLGAHPFHDLRNTAMATWASNGVKPWNVSFWGAHQEGVHMAKVTRGHYTGRPEIDWSDAEKMEAHLTPEGRRARMGVVR